MLLDWIIVLVACLLYCLLAYIYFGFTPTIMVGTKNKIVV